MSEGKLPTRPKAKLRSYLQENAHICMPSSEREVMPIVTQGRRSLATARSQCMRVSSKVQN
eukprot:680840-Pleurochrysis_carterae.AAC.2